MITNIAQFLRYQAFVSGCDDGASVSGASHKVVDWNQSEIHRNATNFIESSFSAVQSGKRIIGSRQMGTVILVALQFFGNLAARLLVRLSWIGALGGVFVGFRKIVQPWMDSRLATSEWERQRHREVSTLDKNQNNDDFVDSGAAQRYFSANRARILHHFEGSTQHVDGSFDWYAQWEEWARQQWTQQQTQQNSQASGQQQQHQQQQKQQRPPRKANQSAKSDFKWDFNPDDPYVFYSSLCLAVCYLIISYSYVYTSIRYSVLGIHRGASKTEISAAFRKQIM